MVFAVFGVCLDFNARLAAGGGHGEGPDLRGMVVADLLLFCIEAHALADEVLAAEAPDVEGHLKTDDQNSLIELLGTLPQWMLSLLLHINIRR